MLTPGSILGAFEIRGSLRAGGMGEVYRAHDPRLQRDVALKLRPAAQTGDQEARGRLLREARAAAALNHPHICTIYEVGETGGQAFIAMELVEGRPLDRVIPAGGLTTREVVDYGTQIADAAAHAHDKGILHRDLKTANIMLTGARRVKVLDFGLAKRVSRDGGPDVTTAMSTLVTEAGRVAGTLAYMSPEQLRGLPATAASDVWALGIVLYEMATGRRPFEGTTSFEIASAILNESPRALPDTVPPALETIINRCLEKDASDRYQQAAELRAALETAESAVGAPSLASRAAARRGHLHPRSMPAWWLPVLAALTAIAVIIWIVVLPRLGLGLEPGISSIAVLPIENLSGNPDEEYLATGVQDGLITELARLRALDRVVERRSTRRFVGSTQPVAEIAAALGVDAVVMGSVLRAGDRIKVNAQLIEASTDRHLWADSFERDTRDVLTIQNDVARAVATAIGVDVSPELQQRWQTTRTVDPETYEAYLRGMHLISRGIGTRADRLRGLAILQQAVDSDPGNAHAYAGLALGYVALGHGPASDPDGWPKARAAAQRAITLDPSLAEAHAALAEVQMYSDWDWQAAEESFRRANALNPNMAMSHYHYSWYLVLFERWDEAIAEHKRAQEVDPLSPQHTAHLGSVYLWQGGRPDDAIVEARKAIDFAPNAPAAYGVLAHALNNKGEYAEAEAAMQKGAALAPPLLEFELGVIYAEQGKTDLARQILDKLESEPPRPWSVWSLSHLHVAVGNYDEAFRWLAHRPAHGFLPWIRVSPPFRAVRKDPRFVALMNEMRLPQP